MTPAEARETLAEGSLEFRKNEIIALQEARKILDNKHLELWNEYGFSPVRLFMLHARGYVDGRIKQQIRAVNFIEKAERIAVMIQAAEVKPRICQACNGNGNCKCDCGNEHDCGTCDTYGVTGVVNITLLHQLNSDRDAFLTAMEIAGKVEEKP